MNDELFENVAQNKTNGRIEANPKASPNKSDKSDSNSTSANGTAHQMTEKDFMDRMKDQIDNI